MYAMSILPCWPTQAVLNSWCVVLERLLDKLDEVDCRFNFAQIRPKLSKLGIWALGASED